MRVLIAVDSFKDCLSALQVANVIKEALLEVHSDWEVIVCPLSDGAEGYMPAVLNARGGKIISLSANNPIRKLVRVSYGILNDAKTAVIDMQKVSGFEAISGKYRNPLNTTTFGLGEIVNNALKNGCSSFVIGVGGSSTNDCGIGALEALGVQFYDKNNMLIEAKAGGKQLQKIAGFSNANLSKKLLNANFTLAVDVKNPLLGKNGAAKVFAPQKGADENMVAALEKGAENFVKALAGKNKKNIDKKAGMGAGGGIAFGLSSFLNVRIKSGFDILADALNLERKIKQNVDLIITGEGKIDAQTNMGKVVGKVIKLAQKYEIPVIVVCGRMEKGENKSFEIGAKKVIEITPKNVAFDVAKKEAEKNLFNAIKKEFLS